MSPSPRRRMSPEQRKETILTAASILFQHAPYSEVSTEAIATKADTSQALVFHYFKSKADLYTTWLEDSFGQLTAYITEAVAGRGEGSSTRDIVQAGLLACADFIQSHPTTWLATQRGGDEPATATNLRLELRDTLYQQLEGLLQPQSVRGRYAVGGAIGFAEAALMDWADAGFPEAEKWPMIEATLGGIEGALGDWGG